MVQTYTTQIRPALAAILLFCGLASSAAVAQEASYAPQGAQGALQPESFATLAPDQLDTLVGAIALYPDPLIAQILPASTYPIDIVRAARLVRSGATSDQLDQQSWDPSVKAISHYPTVLQMMDDNIDWTQQLGQAFIAQPDDVMQSIQRLRLQAQNLGNLATNSQQQIFLEDSAVRIIPANPDVIYVPVYQPSVVYYQPAPVYSSYVSFGFGLPCGAWLDLDCDWNNHWFYRPGWTWNHWHDNFIIDRDRFIRPRHDFEPHRGDRNPTVWRRDNDRPLTFPGHRLTRPSQFDQFRGRDNNRDSTHFNDRNRGDAPTRRPVQVPTPRSEPMDRGRNPSTPTHSIPPPATDHTQRGLERGQSSRRSELTHDGPVSSPPITTLPVAPRQAKPAPIAAPPRDNRPSPSPTPRDVQPMPPVRANHAPAPKPIAAPPAHINTPPVHIAPPPAAATRPATPAYVQPPQRDDNTKRGLHK